MNNSLVPKLQAMNLAPVDRKKEKKLKIGYKPHGVT